MVCSTARLPGARGRLAAAVLRPRKSLERKREVSVEVVAAVAVPRPRKNWERKKRAPAAAVAAPQARKPSIPKTPEVDHIKTAYEARKTSIRKTAEWTTPRPPMNYIKTRSWTTPRQASVAGSSSIRVRAMLLRKRSAPFAKRSEVEERAKKTLDSNDHILLARH